MKQAHLGERHHLNACDLALVVALGFPYCLFNGHKVRHSTASPDTEQSSAARP
jgi:hypothetical protein